MTMPSIVSNERSVFERSDESATRITSPNSISFLLE